MNIGLANMNIVTYTQNQYRIGDIIDADHPEIIDFILKTPSLHHSFIGKFLQKTSGQNIIHKSQRLNIAANIVKDMLHYQPNKKAPPDSLIIHLRLGDILNVTPGMFEKKIYENRKH